MNGKSVALLLIGFQNDYFSKDGILNGSFEDANAIDPLLKNTQSLIRTVIDAGGMVVETPINFTADYSELDEPIGILKVIKDNKAFIRDEYGSQSVPMVKEFAGEIGSLPGKRGMSCFSNTELDKALKSRGVTHLMIAGAFTSLCIDSAGREALDLGYKVIMLSDCTIGRTLFEHKYYLDEIMPLYSLVLDSEQIKVELAA